MKHRMTRFLSVAAAVAAFAVLSGCPGSGGGGGTARIDSVRVDRDTGNPGEAFAGIPGTVNFRIVVAGEGGFPIDLRGSHFEVRQQNGAALPAGITVGPGAIDAAGVAAALVFAVDVPYPGQFALRAFAHGIGSQPFLLSVSESVSSVTVSPNLADPGMAFVGTAGTLNYLITVVGYQGIFPIEPGADRIAVTLEDGSPLPAGITVSPGRITASGTAAPLEISVDMEQAGVFSLVATVLGRESEPFDLVVARADSVAAQIAALRAMSQPPATFTIETTDREERLAPQVLDFDGRQIAIELRGGFPGDGQDLLILSGMRAMFTVGSGVTLNLENIVLFGLDNSGGALIVVNGGGTVNMGANSVIAGNNNISLDPANQGGGVRVAAGGTFSMQDGAIVTDNASMQGGGVFNNGTVNIGGGTVRSNLAGFGGGVFNNGNLSMTGGEIHGNMAVQGGGAVNNDNGTFTLGGSGEISVNVAVRMGEDEVQVFGGGVANHGTFNMEGNARLIDNTATGDGGGVFSPGTFNLRGGLVGGNRAVFGGGIDTTGGHVSMTGGTVSGNRAEQSGGGVLVWEGTFHMRGGAISGNTAEGSSGGGGVGNVSGRFLMGGGIIHGTDAASAADRNAALAAPTSAAVVSVAREGAAGPTESFHGEFIGNQFRTVGILPSTNLTIEMGAGGDLVAPVTVNGVTVSGMTAYAGYEGRLLLFIGGQWVQVASMPVPVSGEATFDWRPGAFVPLGSREIRLRFWDADAGDYVAGYRATNILGLGFTSLSLGNFEALP